MPHPVIQPFPFPERYFKKPENLHAAKSMKDYVKIFERRRDERPGGKFAPADVEELMRLAEDLDRVHKIEIGYIRKLVREHSGFFRNAAQIKTLTNFADRHIALNQARKDDPFVDSIAGVAPLRFFRKAVGARFIDTAQRLSAAIQAADEFQAKHDAFDPNLVQDVNDIADELRGFIKDLTLSDVDKAGRTARRAHRQNILNLLRRPFGNVSHEAKWERSKRRWKNWNRDVIVYPKTYRKPKDRAALAKLVKKSDVVRLVAGGHNFNIASSMGGRKSRRIGSLVTLDDFKLKSVGGSRAKWTPVDGAAATYGVAQDQAKRVVRASAGIRLRDFTKAMGKEGMALPVAGSTDAQSLGGLIATDLHSTGRSSGFLSEQILELVVLDARGREHRFVKNEKVRRGRAGRWTWSRPNGSSSALSWLPVAGALGTLGVVSEVVVKLVPNFNLRSTQLYVPRKWAEDNIHELLSTNPSDDVFDYDHVSFYYGGGAGPDLQTVRLNGWQRTTDPIPKGAHHLRTQRELLDHVGSAFLPDTMLSLGKLKSPDPSSPTGSGDFLIKKLNKNARLVLAAGDAFARKLYFQHDEVELGVPLMNNGAIDYSIYKRALVDVQEMLLEEELRTVIEVRFTPDASEAMISPGTGGPVCYIELATPFGEYSKKRIVQVFHRFDHLLRDKYNARVHIGKKTAVTYGDMANTYGNLWDEFHDIRKQIDPGEKFLPKENRFLSQIFRKGAGG